MSSTPPSLTSAHKPLPWRSRTLAAPRLQTLARKLRRRRSLLLLLLLLFMVFEVIVHHLPPDGVTVTTMTTASVTIGGDDARVSVVTRSVRYSGAQGQTAIRHLTSVFDTAPRDPPLYYFVLPDCGGLTSTDEMVVFTWHGLPVQTWTTHGGCPTYLESSGGLPNLFWSRTPTFASQQRLAPFEP